MCAVAEHSWQEHGGEVPVYVIYPLKPCPSRRSKLNDVN
ncbi:hypothetical protein XBJ1_0924 [Xenorhabdus bovienii SS-2004]|uniref:Uncharacterized protein n=1 Tax=Xenorhabdus bovienii (strain SS-2004) TaxID=406818 RepID=D3UZN6_XENBS|nr:hypothetical protein XBJ1_0924 [Xenorhabdus bovienii SS-2004]